MAKQKHYRELRIAKIRSIVFMLTDIAILSKKSQIDLIDLTFLKKTEQQIDTWHKLIVEGSKIPVKRGKDS